ncbi:MAG: tetratricopeptide repeat protein [Bacteroidota bacterium]
MRVLAVAVLCVLFFPVHAQKVDKYLFLGREAEEAKDYYKAAEIYREGAAVTVTNAKLNFHYAEVLRLLNEYELSQKYYQLTLAIDSLNEYPVSLYWIAMMQKNNGNYKESLGNWELLKRLYSSDPSSDIYRKAVQETEVCAAILKGGIPTYPNKIWNLETLNTINAEFAASYYDSTGLIFSSLEKAGKERDKKEKFIELHAAIRDQGKWNESALLPAQINATGFQNANGSFSSDKKYFVFTRCDQPATCMIYIAIYRNGAYSEAYPLKVNLPGYNTTQPCLVKTDNGYVLFFSSDRPGGSGGLDIWYALADEKLNIGEPMNCPGVNSTEDDITPFYFHPTKELFFSSTWFGGMGGMDIFKSATDLSSFETTGATADYSPRTVKDRNHRLVRPAATTSMNSNTRCGSSKVRLR